MDQDGFGMRILKSNISANFCSFIPTSVVFKEVKTHNMLISFVFLSVY